MDPQKVWQAVLGELEVTLSKAHFITWFNNTSLVSVENGVALVTVPSAYSKEWLQRKYYADLLRVLQKRSPGCEKVEFTVSQTPAAPRVVSPATPAATESPTIGTTISAKTSGNARYTFASFVTGDSNSLAHAAALAVAKAPGGIYNPLFFYGGAGLGKTHLMQAIGATVLAETDKKVLYVPAEKFTNELIGAISQNKTAAFKSKYRHVDVLLVDDVQFLAGKEGTQEEFFHTFNALHGEGKQIVLSSDRPPKSIPTLEDRLRSRFEGGMIADLKPPDLETRRAILRSKADHRGYTVSDEVLGRIAKDMQQNIRELEGALIRIMAHAELTGEAPSMNLAESVLNTIGGAHPGRQVSTTQIIEAVCRFYNISAEELRGPRRQKEVVRPRQLLMFLLREEASLSYPKIGQELGGRDHTTVIHAVEKIGQEAEINEPLRHELSLIKERLYA